MSGWDQAENWYSGCVGKEGHYYHQAVVLPRLLPLLDLQPGHSLLDLGCGQGILARNLPGKIAYTGVDLSSKLIAEAKKITKTPSASFIVSDASKPLSITHNAFDRACFLLSLQNMEHPERAIQNAALHLKEKGKLLLVLNHPCFRIPRQSGWGIDEMTKLQYRKINSYMSPMQIPLAIHPSQGEKGGVTMSYHHSLSHYILWLQKHGFLLYALEEWCSDKKSTGPKAKMENRARKEIPLFLTLGAMLCNKPPTH